MTATEQCPICNDITPKLAFICSFVCFCSVNPMQSQTGRNMKQMCVDASLDAVNQVSDTGIRPQVGYYMPRGRGLVPQPLMLKDSTGQETTEPIRNFGHMINRIRNLKTPASALLKDEIEQYTKGELRIPDAVVLRDPAGLPSQDNLLGVVEVKFRGDRWGDGQETAYRRIAGSDEGLHELNEDTCKCNGTEQQLVPEDSLQPARDLYEQEEEHGLGDSLLLGLEVLAIGIAMTALVLDDATGIGTADDVLLAPLGARAALQSARFYRGTSTVVRGSSEAAKLVAQRMSSLRPSLERIGAAF
jgi:VRR-NUC domain.